MKKLKLFIAFFTVLTSGILTSQITPEFEIGAKGVVSGNLNINSEESNAVSDFSDTQLLLGLKQKLYSSWRSDFVVGFQFPDANSNLGQVYFNNVFIKVEDLKNIFKIGRSTALTILNEFPTLRDDDAMKFIYTLNPFSNGDNTERDQYANVLEYTRIVKQRVLISLHGENFYKNDSPDDFKLNSMGFALQYRIPESQKWNRNFLQDIGISFNNYFTNNKSIKSSLKYLIFSTTLNLKPDPINFIDFKFQSIYNFGLTESTNFADYSDYTRSKSTSMFGMIRYIKQKYERLDYQISVGAGYKTFADTDTDQLIFVGNAFYRVGDNFDLGVQYRYTKNNGLAKNLFGENENRIQLAFVYSFDKVFNKQFDNRNSILNLEHKYIK